MTSFFNKMNHIINSNVKNTKRKKLFEEKIASLLVESIQSPYNSYINGIFSLSNDQFVINKKLLSTKLGINVNSMNKNFRHHNFRLIRKYPIKSAINLPDPSGWTIYQHSNPNFTMQNILSGQKPLTTKWDGNITKRSNKVENMNDTTSNNQIMTTPPNINSIISPIENLPNLNSILQAIPRDSHPKYIILQFY